MMQISLNFVENINQVCNLLWHMTTDYTIASKSAVLQMN